MKTEPIFNLGTLFNYINEFYPELKFWDGPSKHESRNQKKSYKHRAGMPNEIRIEFDSKDTLQNWLNVNETSKNLWDAGYSFAVFSVEGGRSPHIHIYDIDELDNFEFEKRNSYRRLFLHKFCPKESEPDFELCDEEHLCALEFATHFKYHKPKELLNLFYQGKNQGIDSDIYCDMVMGKKEPERIKKLLHKRVSKRFGDTLKETQRDLVIKHLNFEQVFDKYNVKYKGRMALCPFHADGNGSLSFTNSNGLWKCWGTGCGEKGDIISLIKKLRELKNGRK